MEARPSSTKQAQADNHEWPYCYVQTLDFGTKCTCSGIMAERRCETLSSLCGACRAQTPASGRKSRFSLPAGNAADATAAQGAGSEPHAPANTPTSALGEWPPHLQLLGVA